MRLALLHPDLGIGGAERLMVDTVMALLAHGHTVEVFTTHHDPHHCFTETKNGMFPVHVFGDWLPRSLAGKAKAICAYSRAVYVAGVFSVGFAWRFDIVIMDSISVAMPMVAQILPVIYYCHFPDMMLTERKSWLKMLYRLPIDFVEKVTSGFADRVLVNSSFTAGVVRDTLGLTDTTILYPTVTFSLKSCVVSNETVSEFESCVSYPFFVSINRFERKKNIELAITSYCIFLSKNIGNQRPKLVVSGGYDPNNEENQEYYIELMEHAKKCLLTVSEYPSGSGDVIFFKSFNTEHKYLLFTRSLSVIYTPENEHFGIVPIEAMHMGKTVIAHASGGPVESVGKNRSRGFLCENEVEFAEAMLYAFQNPAAIKKMGDEGSQYVERTFGWKVFANHWNEHVIEIATRKRSLWRFSIVVLICIAFLIINFKLQ